MQSSLEGKEKLKALRISAIAIFSVVIVEVALGVIVNSLAIISDGLHALLDAFSSVMLFFVVRASLKPPDEEHMYGHEKFEAIGGLIGGLVLIVVALVIFYEAVLRLITPIGISGNIGYAGFIAIAYALFIALLRVTVFRNKSLESQSMKAGLYDAISDLGSTIIALIGFGLALLGVVGADAFASIFLGAMLTYLSLKLAKSSIMELSDSASKDLVVSAQKVIQSCDGVLRIENLKIRKVSSKVFIEASIQVPQGMGLEDAHSLATKIETCLKDTLGNVDATIHIEPYNQEKKLKQIIKEQATVLGVKEVHEIEVCYIRSKLYMTLHAYVDPEISVEEAHKIAETIELRIRQKIKSVENVTVHIEPFENDVSELINEARLRKIVYEVAKSTEDKLEVKHILTYSAGGKHYINIDCCFTKHVSIKDAHKLASFLEKETKERFANSVVTVHMEPKSN
ncbi:MAG: cation-efflux pump [Crenarchaeota archaeon]|nr:cation-efflux pump [Thermoproteota archaeon]